MKSFLLCNKCGRHGCKRVPEMGSYCSRYTKPKWIKANTIFDNLVHKSEAQAVNTLSLLDKADISWQRYTK